MNKPMKYLRKSPLIILILLGIWLWTSYSYSTTVECSCCTHNDYQRGCSKKGCEDQLSLTHKKHQEGNHQKDNNYHPEDNNHHQDGNCCSCIKCGKPYADEMALKAYWTEIEKKQVLTLGQDTLERKISLPENIFTYQERKPTTKFLSLFLLKSSFLL